MIDLTPLDVRKKAGDFHRGLRGYDVAEVDHFLGLVAERMEELVREATQLRERNAELVESLNSFRQREQAMNDALVSAQQLREQIREQTQRDAELSRREAEAEGARLIEAARRRAEQEREAVLRLEAHRDRFLRSYRNFLEAQLEEISTEEERLVRARAGEPDPSGAG